MPTYTNSIYALQDALDIKLVEIVKHFTNPDAGRTDHMMAAHIREAVRFDRKQRNALIKVHGYLMHTKF
jgi:hypothetical protein